MRLRESSGATYITLAGRRAARAAQVDAAEHYGSGAADLIQIMQELPGGSVAIGIRFWSKFMAFALDWGAALDSNVAAGELHSDRIVRSGSDIWKSGTTSVSAWWRLVDSDEKLLAKRGSI